MSLTPDKTEARGPALSACSNHLGKHKDLTGVEGVEFDNFLSRAMQSAPAPLDPDEDDTFYATRFFVNLASGDGELTLRNGSKPVEITLLSRRPLEFGENAKSESVLHEVQKILFHEHLGWEAPTLSGSKWYDTLANVSDAINDGQVAPKRVEKIGRWVCENVDGKSVKSEHVSFWDETPYNARFRIDSSVILSDGFAAFGPISPSQRLLYRLEKDSLVRATSQGDRGPEGSSYSVIPKSSILTTKPLSDPNPGEGGQSVLNLGS